MTFNPTFNKTLIKPSSFKTTSKRSSAAALKTMLIQLSHEASQGYGRDEFNAICKEFLAQTPTTAQINANNKAEAEAEAQAEANALAAQKAIDDLIV